MTDKEAMDVLIRRGLKEKIITLDQVVYSDSHPGTYIGVNGFMGRKCSICKDLVPLHQMFSEEECLVCHELLKNG